MKEQLERAEQGVAALLAERNERWYPTFHIAAKAGWINDPNGLSYFNGRYQVYFQHHPFGTQWGPMHWGHVSSEDLVTWRREPIAMAPSIEADRDGVFSGSAVVGDDGKLYAYYTGHRWRNGINEDEGNLQVQCLATSQDGLTFEKQGVLASKKPVTYSHCLPAGLKEHPRNKSDEQLKFIADRGGFIGVTMFPPFLKRGIESTVDDYVEALDYVINLVGEDGVGIGTDHTQGYGQDFFDHITHDKGRGRRLTNFGTVLNPEGIRTIGEMPNLTDAMERAGWKPERIVKVIGGNWLRVFGEVWGA